MISGRSAKAGQQEKIQQAVPGSNGLLTIHKGISLGNSNAQFLPELVAREIFKCASRHFCRRDISRMRCATGTNGDHGQERITTNRNSPREFRS